MAHILIVDDSAFARATLRQKLTESGHVVSEAASGVEALEMLATQHFDLVTMDLLMPEMEGSELLQNIRKLSSSMPVVVITADIQTQTREELIARGASAFINKPVNFDILLETVNHLLAAKA